MTAFGLMGNTSPRTSQDVIMSRKWVNRFHSFTEGSWAIPYPKEKSEVDLGFQTWSITALKKVENKKEEGSKNNVWPFSTLHKMKEKNKHTHYTHKTIKYLAPLWKFKPYVQLKTRSLALFSYFGEFSKSRPEPFLCLYSCCWFYVQTTDVQAQISIAVCPTSSSAFRFPSTRSRNEIVFSLGRSPQSHLVIKKLAVSLDRNTTSGCCNCQPPPHPQREKFYSNTSS